MMLQIPCVIMKKVLACYSRIICSQWNRLVFRSICMWMSIRLSRSWYTDIFCYTHPTTNWTYPLVCAMLLATCCVCNVSRAATETSLVSPGYMDGAVVAAERAVSEVIEACKTGQLPNYAEGNTLRPQRSCMSFSLLISLCILCVALTYYWFMIR